MDQAHPVDAVTLALLWTEDIVVYQSGMRRVCYKHAAWRSDLVVLADEVVVHFALPCATQVSEGRADIFRNSICLEKDSEVLCSLDHILRSRCPWDACTCRRKCKRPTPMRRVDENTYSGHATISELLGRSRPAHYYSLAILDHVISLRCCWKSGGTR